MFYIVKRLEGGGHYNNAPIHLSSSIHYINKDRIDYMYLSQEFGICVKADHDFWKLMEPDSYSIRDCYDKMKQLQERK